jgi:DNA adenine methylase
LSHGGRGSLAGPQGGFDQSGTYKIDCRWNPTKLCREIKLAHELLTSVPLTLTNKHYSKVKGDYYYMDPPYYEVGDQLYPCFFTDQDHIDLYEFLATKANWLLSYNNTGMIKKLYGAFQKLTLSTAGNGGNKHNSELIILSQGI